MPRSVVGAPGASSMSDVSRLGVPLAIGLGWTVERPLAGGEFGALLVERRGVHAVFKVMPKDAKSEWLEEALFVASQLLETGYPLPRYFDAGTRDGHGYTVQEHVEGIPARRPVSYTHLRAHETVLDLLCRLLL